MSSKLPYEANLCGTRCHHLIRLRAYPLTKHMGITVLAVDDVQISLLAPYAPNINHRETIFGGSISSLGILAGWALLWAKLQVEETPNRLVIQSSSTNFMKPATDAIVACCQCDRASWLTF
ncbi:MULTISPECIES: YiiD C-terminal domain-containing protein [Cyanophyceae]|uniref:YiiD C-terminal domain-containing protein n=1 Tax=Cyanophyceae TaxID=3028117 RepID=UPI0032204241